MDVSREKTLELMVNTESKKCFHWSDFEHSSLHPSSKSHNFII